LSSSEENPTWLKKTFIENLKSPTVEAINNEDGGGDYWVIANSAICNAYKERTVTAINEKIEEVREKLATRAVAKRKTCMNKI
jgi:hypothetical protein